MGWASQAFLYLFGDILYENLSFVCDRDRDQTLFGIDFIMFYRYIRNVLN